MTSKIRKLRTGRFVVYWEKSGGNGKPIRGFVSYDNSHHKHREEYFPLDLEDASIYATREEAENVRNWYRERGGFGNFTIMEIA